MFSRHIFWGKGMRGLAVLLALFGVYPAMGTPLCCIGEAAQSSCCAPVLVSVPASCCGETRCPDEAPVRSVPCSCEWNEASAELYVVPVANQDVGAPALVGIAHRTWALTQPVWFSRHRARGDAPLEESPPLTQLCRFLI